MEQNNPGDPQSLPQNAATFRNVPKRSEQAAPQPANDSEADLEQAGKLEKEVMDPKILNKGKDFLIDQLRQEREGFFDQLLDARRKLGELETKLLQLKAPALE